VHGLALQRLLERAHRPLEVAARQADELARLALDLQAGVAVERLDEAAEQALRQRVADHDRLVDVAGRKRGYETRPARRLVLRTRQPDRRHGGGEREKRHGEKRAHRPPDWCAALSVAIGPAKRNGAPSGPESRAGSWRGRDAQPSDICP
jgi:hypothetical protein